MRWRMSSARTAAATWWSNTARTENSSPARDSRTARTRSRIWKRSVFRVRSAEKKWSCARRKKGRKYYGCENNPECDFMSWQKPSAKKCPQCGGYMLEKGNKLVCADEQCGYVEAREKKDEDWEWQSGLYWWKTGAGRFFLLIEAEKQEDPKKFSMNFYKFIVFWKYIDFRKTTW